MTRMKRTGRTTPISGRPGPTMRCGRRRTFSPQYAYRAANFPPGQGCRYGNCGYVLLRLLREQASGLSYRDHVRQRIFAPAGMLQSDFFRVDGVTDNVAEGCDPLRDAHGAGVAWLKHIYSYPPIGSPDGVAHQMVARTSS